MAVKGKRNIFVDACTVPAQEGKALEADILPGMSVVFSATGLSKGIGLGLTVADYDMLGGCDNDQPWTIDENMISRQVESGKRANVYVLAGVNITAVGTGLSPAAGGNWVIDNVTPKVTADEIINVTGAPALVRVRGI